MNRWEKEDEEEKAVVFPRGVILEQWLGEGGEVFGGGGTCSRRKRFRQGPGGPNALARILRPVGHFPPPPPYAPSNPNAPTL